MPQNAFQFRFQKLLDTKEKQEQALEIEIARIERSLNDCMATRDRWQRIKAEALDALREARSRADLVVNARYAAYLPHVRAQIRRCCSQAASLEDTRERVRERLTEMMQSRKMLEKYREKLLREFAATQERAEERALDSHSIRKFVQAGMERR